jgi:RimJ/RimL family protein N-acetyltransferase
LAHPVGGEAEGDPSMDIPMMQLRPLIPEDMAVIGNWPPYPPEFADLDYALRDNGWLSEYRSKPETWCFAVEQSGELIAFTILSTTGAAKAEFRIALRGDRTGQGLGRAVTAMTLAKGFAELGLTRIHLIVRKNNPRASRLYSRLGFTEQGECFKNINGKQTHFLIMELPRESYALQGVGA